VKISGRKFALGRKPLTMTPLTVGAFDTRGLSPCDINYDIKYRMGDELNENE